MTLSNSGKKIADLLPPLVVGILILVGWEVVLPAVCDPLLSGSHAERDREDLPC